MTHFNYLDTLLKAKIDSLALAVDERAPLNPYYISHEDVLHELSKPTNIELLLLDDLVQKLQLSPFEKDVLLILFAVDIEEKYERIYAYIQDDMNKKYPTAQLISSLLQNDTISKKDILNYFTSDSKLSLFNLFEIIETQGSYSIFTKQLKISQSLSSFFLQNIVIDTKVSNFCRLHEQEEEVYNVNNSSIENIKKNIEEHQAYLFNIIGSSSKINILKAQAIASEYGFSLLLISSSRIPSSLDTLSLLKIVLRDALLSNSLLFFEDFDYFLKERKEDESILFEQLAQLSWMSFFATTKLWNPKIIPQRPLFVAIEPEKSSQNILQEQWHRALCGISNELANSLSKSLAQNFKFSSQKIEDVSTLLQAKKLLGNRVDATDVFDTCRLRVEKNLEEFAQHLPSKHNFNEIILQSEQKNQLKEIISHYMNQETVFDEWNFQQHFQSRGLGVLFCGASGTGKTMAASILAHSLGLELYRIELSKIVSKYIGETEKNLSKIFEVAQESGIVLFFDEADAIFGKRSEVKDAHDRYANIEVSYLLQKIEEYDGLVILASNFKNNIDEAFVRRMRFIVDFTLPNEAEREQIWRKMFSQDTCTDEIDFKLLGKNFKLSGANIRNAALYAAFNAVENSQKLNMSNIMSGVKSELTKIGKPFREKDFEVFKK